MTTQRTLFDHPFFNERAKNINMGVVTWVAVAESDLSIRETFSRSDEPMMERMMLAATG